MIEEIQNLSHFNLQGDWSGGMMNGQGRYEWADGVVYSGTIVNNQIDGVGAYEWPDGRQQIRKKTK